MRLRKIVVSLAFFAICDFCHASGFTAVCIAENVHAYRHQLGISGQDNGGEWTDNEKFPGKWTFAYQGGEKLELDGKNLPIVFWNGVVMAAVDHNASDSAVSTWVYAINLDLEEVVGSQVNGFRSVGSGLKARSVNYRCEFTRHAETRS